MRFFAGTLTISDCYGSVIEVTLKDTGKMTGVKPQQNTKHNNWGRFYQHGWILIPAQISDYVHCKVWYKIIYPFPNVNSCTGKFGNV